VWIPNVAEVGKDFVPYATAGSWAYDRVDGWDWLSKYDWGWAPFHYGRWCLGAAGWAWVPGRTFAPAWVEWKNEPGIVAWAPMPPSFAWRHGVAEAVARVPSPPSRFVRVSAPELYVSASGPIDDAGLALAKVHAHPPAAVIKAPLPSVVRDEAATSRTEAAAPKTANRSAHGENDRARSERAGSERATSGHK